MTRVGIGNRRDLHDDRGGVFDFIAWMDETGNAVHTELIARRLGVAWQEAQSLLTAMHRTGHLKYELVDRPYRDGKHRGRTYQTFRWWPRAGARRR